MTEQQITYIAAIVWLIVAILVVITVVLFFMLLRKDAKADRLRRATPGRRDISKVKIFPSSHALYKTVKAAAAEMYKDSEDAQRWYIEGELIKAYHALYSYHSSMLEELAD